MAKDRDYTLMPQIDVQASPACLMQEKTMSMFAFSNARYVRNVIEKAIRHQAVRLMSQYPAGSPGKQELMAVRPEDLKWEK